MRSKQDYAEYLWDGTEPPADSTAMPAASRGYAQYCRPRLASLMQALSMDKAYHKAVGDYLFYSDEQGCEVQVTDFLGGFGASLFGHNHPALVAVAKNSLERNRPFNAQVSTRSSAASLCAKLDELLFARTGRHFITTLASTGTEAVEAAIKHAELAHQKRIERILEELRKTIITLKKRYHAGSLRPAPEFAAMIEAAIGGCGDPDFGKQVWTLRDYAKRAFQKPPVFLSLVRAFHGKTSGSVQLTHNEEYRVPFSRIGIDVVFVNPDDPGSLQRAVDQATITYLWPEPNEQGDIQLTLKRHVNISAFFIEPLQGEGGIHAVPRDFLALAREICTRHAIPLVFDEIQSGVGRTGTFLFSEQQNIVADYYLLSKSLGGGLSKIAAMMVPREMYEEEFGVIHSSTFAEDGHSAAIALAALNLLEHDPFILDNCRARGEQLKAGLTKLQQRYPTVIKDVRGQGLMLGVEFAPQDAVTSKPFRAFSGQMGYIIAGYLLSEHCIRVAPTLSQHATIRIEPSAYISPAECDRFLGAIDRLCEITLKQNFYALTKFIVGAATPFTKAPVEDLSQPYIPNVKSKTSGHVAFMGHFIKAHHLHHFGREFLPFTPEQCLDFLTRIHLIIDPFIAEQRVVKSLTGEEVTLSFIALPIDSQLIAMHMLANDLEPIQAMVEKAVALAIAQGCQAVGFGGFSSIVSRNCESIYTDSISLTTGNSFTVAMGLEAMHTAAQQAGIDLDTARYAGIGANGNICSIYSEIMAELVPRIILIGRPGRIERLRMVAADIYANAFAQVVTHAYPPANGPSGAEALRGVAGVISKTRAAKELLRCYRNVDQIGLWLLDRLQQELGDDAPVILTEDYDYLKEANLIVGASNTYHPVIFPHMLGEGPIIINDIALPEDTDESVRIERPDVMWICGGLVRLPLNPDFFISGIPLEPGLSYACMAETLLMGLTNLRGDFSFGKINRTQVKKIREIARIHGFALGSFKTERSY
jgi:acetylornithine/succinyldiaminopimelate/putrescine aminotransferase/predicted amino acid dehydrogenase